MHRVFHHTTTLIREQSSTQPAKGMDWTGGARRRFAPKKSNVVLQRQKAYFARARAALNNTTAGNTAIQAFTNELVSRSRSNASSHRPLPGSTTRHTSELHAIDANPRMSTRGLSSTERHYGQMTSPSSRRLELQSSTHRSPSAISAGSLHSSKASSTQSRQVKDHQSSYQLTTATAVNMNEEERLLLANRRRLLAQGDWLGLTPAQPLRTKFSSSHDKDRIGKRRKIGSVRSKKGKPAAQRLLPPLFDERLLQQDHFMSGALPQNDFQFKIGTDALASQTQASNCSHTAGKTSLRQPSTEFELLSEKSMLLGPEEQTFDPLQATFVAHPPGRSLSPQTQHMCAVPNMERPMHERNMDEQLIPLSAGNGLQDETMRNHRRIQGCEQGLNEWVSYDRPPQNLRGRTHQDGAQILAATHHQRHVDESETHHFDGVITKSQCSAVSSTADGNEEDDYSDDDEESWRKFMNAAKPGLSNQSVVAVKSSSVHLTTSESSHRPILIHQHESHHVPVLSTPNGAGTQGSPILAHVQTSNEYTSSAPPQGWVSPTTSVKPIQGLVTQHRPPTAAAQTAQDANELWRQFVCGPHGDSDTSSQPGIASSYKDADVENTPAVVPASSYHIVSDLGTSTRATNGDGTTLVPESRCSTSSMMETTSPNLDAESFDEDRDPRVPSAASPYDNDDDDSIEDEEPLAVQKAPTKNIHATQTSILDPKRFKPPRHRRQPPAKPVPKLFVPRPPQRQSPKQACSVYDLVDSDGNSVA